MIGDKFTLAVDFDGVIASHNYPGIGELYEPAKEVINRLYDTGRFYIIIWSTRAGADQDTMVDFLSKHDIKYHAINENNPAFIEAIKGQPEPRKLYYEMVIDDRALPWFDFNDKIAWELLYKVILGHEYYVRLNDAKSKKSDSQVLNDTFTSDTTVNESYNG